MPMNPAMAALIDYAATIAFSSLGKEATALLLGTWLLDGNAPEQMLPMLQAEVRKNEGEAQAAIDRMPG